MELKKVANLTLSATPPFNFDATFHKPDHFPSQDNYCEPGVRWQTYFWQGKQVGLKFADAGTKAKPAVQVEVFYSRNLDPQFLESLKQEIIYRYNLHLDLTDFYSQFGKDPVLKESIKRLYGMRPGHAGSLYEYLVIGIVLQNTFVKRSVQMLQTLFEHYGKLLKFDGKQLWAFWQPGSLEAVSELDLRALKLGYRAKSLKKLDDAFRAGQIDELALREADLETQKQELLKLYGVGPATVWYLLFDIFHQYDFFTHISPWEQKIYSKLFFDRDPEHPLEVDELLRYFDRFGNYRQLAVHYIWEDLWWKRKNQSVPWLEKLIRL